jgi:hypothetical protein
MAFAFSFLLNWSVWHDHFIHASPYSSVVTVSRNIKNERVRHTHTHTRYDTHTNAFTHTRKKRNIKTDAQTFWWW